MELLTEYKDTVAKTTAVALIVVTLRFIYNKSKCNQNYRLKNVDYNLMSKALDKEGLIRSSLFMRDSTISFGRFNHLETIYDLFQCGLLTGADKNCLGYKTNVTDIEYKWYTYAQVDQAAIELGSGIITSLDQSAGQRTMIGVFMRNCPEWVFVEQACTRYSMILVPLYDTLGEEACIYIINHTAIQVIFVDDIKKVNFLLKNYSKIPTLKSIVTKLPMTNEIVDIENCPIKIHSFQQIKEDGSKNIQPLKLPTKDDICTICFTSGTTGVPKGCVITNLAIITSVSASFIHLECMKFGEDQEVHFSYLPLTHIYERLAHLLIFMACGKMYFFSGDIYKLFDEMQTVRPTILCTVPRLLNRLYDKIMMSVNRSFWKSHLFQLALRCKSRDVKKGVIRTNTIWDWLVFNKVQQATGGQLKLIIVASAPISDESMLFMRTVMGCMVVEGYGQTETCGPCTLTLPGDHDMSQVGPPVPGVSIKLEDVEELNLVAVRDRKGEICIKGDIGIKEYYNWPEMTAKLIDKDGWLHTGDVGLWTEKGQLRIVDRCKHIFKLSQGEYLAPERLENIYILSPLVSQIYVTGNSFHSYCVAVVVPDLEGWQELPNGKALYTNLSDICNDSQSNSILLKELASVGRKNGLNGFEIVKKVVLTADMMTAENDLLTPTLKLKRANADKYFSLQVQVMYKE